MYSEFRKFAVQSWIELPMLVDQFVHRVAPALGCSQEQLRGFICEDLGLQEYEGLGRICRLIAEIYGLVDAARHTFDVAIEQSDHYMTGLAAATVSAWHEGGDDVGALQVLDREGVEGMKSLPWRIWSEWERDARGLGMGVEGSEDEVRKEAAYLVLSDFMESCDEWRDEILTAYTLVRDGTPVGSTAFDAACDLVRHVSAAEYEELESKVKGVLGARGFYADLMGNAFEVVKRGADAAEAKLEGWRRKRYDALLARVESGEGVIQVRELRGLFRWLPPELVDGCYEDGPCMWQVLARMNDDAYVEVSTGGEGDSLCPFTTVYVDREGDIAEALRCTGAGGEAVRVVSRDEALKEGVAHIAGWYAVRWWD